MSSRHFLLLMIGVIGISILTGCGGSMDSDKDQDLPSLPADPIESSTPTPIPTATPINKGKGIDSTDAGVGNSEINYETDSYQVGLILGSAGTEVGTVNLGPEGIIPE